MRRRKMKKWQLADNFFILRLHRAKPANEKAAGFRMCTAGEYDIIDVNPELTILIEPAFLNGCFSFYSYDNIELQFSYILA